MRRSSGTRRAGRRGRYLFTDGVLAAVRGSPPGKVATLSRDSLALLHHVRVELDRRKAFETAPPDVRRPLVPSRWLPASAALLPHTN
jgi:hypothetical protein